MQMEPAAHYKSYIGYQFRLDNSGDEAHLITSRFAPSKVSNKGTILDMDITIK